MIEISLDKIQMPEINKRRFQYNANKGNINSFWYITDTHNKKIVSKGNFQDIQFRCYYLNKQYYKQLK